MLRLSAERNFRLSVQAQTPGQSCSLAKTAFRHSPQPISSAACAGIRRVGLSEIVRKQLQRLTASGANSDEGFGLELGRRTIRFWETPALTRASATARNDDPLSPGPSSTTRNNAPRCTLLAIHC